MDNRNRTIIFIMALCFGVNAQAINLSGKVTNALNGESLQGAVVLLKNNQLFDSTRADGTYHLSTVGIAKNVTPKQLFTKARLKNGILEINVYKTTPLTVEMFSLNGAQRAPLCTINPVMPGLFKVEVRKACNAANLFLIRIRQGNESTIVSLLSMQSSGASILRMEKSLQSLSKRAEFSDTLVFTRSGFTIAKKAITTLTGENDIALQPMGSVSIAAVSISYDFAAGNIGLYSVSDSTAYKNQLSTWNDNDVRSVGGSLYVLERYGKDNLLKINGPGISNATVAYEKNIGASVNIQDIAVIDSTKAYITQYASSYVAIFIPSLGSLSKQRIDLSAFNTYAGTPDSDVVPYMSRALYYNGKVYIACQRLKAPAGGYIQAADTSKIIVINAATDSVVKAINLRYKNPQELSIFNGKLYVGSVGMWGVNDGGIEEIDLSTDANIGSTVGEAAFLGDIASIIVVSATKGYAVISTPSFTTELRAFNPLAGTVGAKISGIDAPCSGHIGFDGNYVYVGDRSSTAPGIVTIDPATDTKVGTTKDIGIPPNSIAVLLTNK